MTLFGDLNPDCTRHILALLDKASLHAVAQVSKTASTISLPFLVQIVVLYLEYLDDERITNNFCNAVQKHGLYPHIRSLRLKIGGTDTQPPNSLRRLLPHLINLVYIGMELDPSTTLRLDLAYPEYGRDFASADYGELFHSLLSHRTPPHVTLHNILLSKPRSSEIDSSAGLGIRYLSLRSPHISNCEEHAEGVERLLLAAVPTLQALQFTGVCLPGLATTRSEYSLEYPEVKTLHVDALPITLAALADAFPKLSFLTIYSDFTTPDRFNPDMWLGDGNSPPVELHKLVSFTGPKTLVKAFLRQSHIVGLRRLCLPARYSDEAFEGLRDLCAFLETIGLNPVTSLTLTIQFDRSEHISTLHLAVERLADAFLHLNFLHIRLYRFELSSVEALHQLVGPILERLSALKGLRYLSILVISNQLYRPPHAAVTLGIVARRYLSTIPSLQYIDVDVVCSSLILLHDERSPGSSTFWRKTQVDSQVGAEQMDQSEALELRSRIDYDGMEVDPLVVSRVD